MSLDSALALTEGLLLLIVRIQWGLELSDHAGHPRWLTQTGASVTSPGHQRDSSWCLCMGLLRAQRLSSERHCSEINPRVSRGCCKASEDLTQDSQNSSTACSTGETSHLRLAQTRGVWNSILHPEGRMKQSCHRRAGGTRDTVWLSWESAICLTRIPSRTFPGPLAYPK